MNRTRVTVVAVGVGLALALFLSMRRDPDTPMAGGYRLSDFLVTGRSFDWPPVPGDVFANLQRTAEAQAVINGATGGKGYITSGWRPPDLNELVGGSATSQHMTGLAADRRPVLSDAQQEAYRAADALTKAGIIWDQIIAYAPERGGHLHVGLASDPAAGRRQLLYAPAGGGYTPLLAA